VRSSPRSSALLPARGRGPARPRRALLAAWILAAGTAQLPAASAHGGLYPRPPSPIPSPTPPGSPTQPGPPGPATSPGAGAAVPGPGSALSPSGATIDLESWELWWNDNQAQYLDLRRRIHGAVPRTGEASAAADEDSIPLSGELRERIVTRLLRVLEEERSVDLRSGALMALAKVGRHAGTDLSARVVPAILGLLRGGNQELAETAAIALGVLADGAALPLLLDLMGDGPRGRAFVGASEVPYRTRAFAAYGLGQAAARSASNAVRQTVSQALVEVVERPSQPTPDLAVAALQALSLAALDLRAEVPPRPPGDRPGPFASHALSRRTQLAYLIDFLTVRRETAARRSDTLRAHAATAAGRLLLDVPDGLRLALLPALLARLEPEADEDEGVREALVLALGSAVSAGPHPLDVAARERLVAELERGKPMARRFASIALGQIGSRPGPTVDADDDPLAGALDVQRALLGRLAHGPAAPWAALAVGILGHGQLARGQTPDPEASAILRSALASCRRPQDVGAYALAVGLRGDVAARAVLRHKLEEITDPIARSHVAIGLGLVGDEQDAPLLRSLLDGALRKPELLTRIAVALALVGDRGVGPRLVDWLQETSSLAGQAAIATALGQVGDHAAIEPLLALLDERARTPDSARAFAVVALGQLASPDRWPWNLPYARGVHYLFAPPTLTDGRSGILDIL